MGIPLASRISGAIAPGKWSVCTCMNHTHTQTHAYIDTNMCMYHTCTQCTNVHTDARTHIYVHTHTFAHMHTPLMFARMDTNMHTHARTYTHRTLAPLLSAPVPHSLPCFSLFFRQLCPSFCPCSASLTPAAFSSSLF